MLLLIAVMSAVRRLHVDGMMLERYMECKLWMEPGAEATALCVPGGGVSDGTSACITSMDIAIVE
jgi:hypothetical protein